MQCRKRVEEELITRMEAPLKSYKLRVGWRGHGETACACIWKEVGTKGMEQTVLGSGLPEKEKAKKESSSSLHNFWLLCPFVLDFNGNTHQSPTSYIPFSLTC